MSRIVLRSGLDFRRFAAGIVLAVAVGLIAIVWMPNVFWRLPYLDYWDERQTFTAAMNMFTDRTLFTNFFSYGSVPQYWALLASLPGLLWLSSQGQPVGDSDIWINSSYGWAPAYWELVAGQRLAWMIVACVAIILFGAVLSKLYGTCIGASATLLLLAIPNVAYFSTRITVDGLGFSLGLLAMASGLKSMTARSWRWAFVSSVCVGLAMATKYSLAVLLIIPLALGWQLNSEISLRSRLWRTLAPAAAAGATALLVSPSVLKTPVDAIRVARYEILRYGSLDGPNAVNPGLDNLMLQVGNFVSSTSAPFLLAGMAGWLILLRSQEGRRVLVVAVVPSLVIAAGLIFTRADYHRNLLLVYAALVTGFVLLLQAIWVNTRLRGLPAVVIIAAVVLAALVPIAQRINDYSHTRFTVSDARNSALALAYTEACESGADIFVDPYLTMAKSLSLPDCPGKEISLYRGTGWERKRAIFIVSAPSRLPTDDKSWEMIATFGSVERESSSDKVPKRPTIDPMIEVWRN